MSCRRIHADFNGIARSRRDPGRLVVPLDTLESVRDLSNAGIRLRDGIPLVIHDASDEIEDLEALAITYYDAERTRWCAELDAFEYVPAGYRRPVTSFLCLGCRGELSMIARSIESPASCPDCGLSMLAAIEPPVE